MDKIKNKKAKKEELITQQNLIDERGWTKTLIKSFLPAPDLTKTNPFYKSASPMKLYLKKRIEKIEKSEDFKTKKQSLEKRIEAAKNKRRNLLEYIENLIIEIPKYKKEVLYRYACEHYNEYHNLWLALRDDFYGLENEATPDSDEDFLKRISMNFLRHSEVIVKDNSKQKSGSDYEYELEKLFGKVGKIEGYIKLKQRINNAILEQYPYLKGE